MTPTSPQNEYIITDDMLAVWRSGCVNWRSQEDGKCYCCDFKGVGVRKGCCDFDDDAMQKIFQSHPAPSPQPICDRCKSDQEPFCTGCDRLIPHDNKLRNATIEELYQRIKAERDPSLEYVDWDSIEAVFIRSDE